MTVIFGIVVYLFTFMFASTWGLIINGFGQFRRKDGGILRHIQVLPALAAVGIYAVSAFAMVKYIIGGGYSRQIAAIGKKGIFNDSIFTNGTASYFYNDQLVKVMFGIAAVLVAVALVHFFIFSSIIQKILMILDLIVLGISITPVIRCGNRSVTKGFREMSAWLKTSFNINIEADTLSNALGVTFLISAVIVLVLLHCSESGFISDGGVISLVNNFMLFPVFILIIQNIIALVLVIIFFIVVALFMGGALGDSVASVPAPRATSAAPKMNKNRNEIERLERQNREISKNIANYHKGSIGVFHIDPKAAANKRSSNEKMIAFLKSKERM